MTKTALRKILIAKMPDATIVLTSTGIEVHLPSTSAAITRRLENWLVELGADDVPYRIVAAKRGPSPTAAVRQKISIALKGRKVSLEALRHMTEARRRRPRSVTPEMIADFRQRIAAGEVPRQIAESYGIGRTSVTFYLGRLARQPWDYAKDKGDPQTNT